MTVKKLINDPKDVVKEALEGMALAHADILRVAPDPAFLVRNDAPVEGKVGIVSGGGSGHEPMHGGLVGFGMLDAAVPGPVFTSPTPDPILEATKAVDAGRGVLHIVKNYTGDVLNFETASDLALAEDIEVRTVLVDDDVAVKDSLYTAGRRGVAGTVLVEKIAGASAERGDDSTPWLASLRGSTPTHDRWGLRCRPARSRTLGSRASTWQKMRSRLGSVFTESRAGLESGSSQLTRLWTVSLRRFSKTSLSHPVTVFSSLSMEWEARQKSSFTSSSGEPLRSSRNTESL